MNRYILIADYDIDQVENFKDKNNVVVSIPMLQNKKLAYGMGNVLDKLIFDNIYPSEFGYDLFLLADMVYLADTRIARAIHSQDSWTREITLVVPVSSPGIWNKQKALIERMLNFLTGDIWKIEFKIRLWVFEDYLVKRAKKTTDLKHVRSTYKDLRTDEYDCATLFSGGMDSLISTINLLEDGKDVLLISHAGDGFTKKAQRDITCCLNDDYKYCPPTWMDLWLVSPNNLIPDGGEDSNLRSRSFLFFAYGVFAMSGTRNLHELLVPENGLIALNVPLDSTRVGSFSTRTTHPFYMDCWNKLLEGLGTNYSVRNPYWNKTKGEMAAECKNQNELQKTMQLSISCSSIAKSRYIKGGHINQCGYCVPCLIRRAAMHKAFGHDVTPYTVESVREMEANSSDGEGVQLRSFEYAINKIKRNPSLAKIYIHKTGPLKNDQEYLDELAGVYRRGLIEVDQFIQDNKKRNI